MFDRSYLNDLWTRTRGAAARLAIGLGAVALAGALTGCLDKTDTAAADQGDVVVSLTDDKGDFLSYAVNVKSLTLVKANGTEVMTLAEPMLVDFTQYTDLTEFLTAATVPSGVYVSAKMVLDYTGADIQVEAADGSPVQVTNIQDANGDAVTELTVNVKLDNANRLVVAPGLPAHLTLDFDLAASNRVNFDSTDAIPESVTVEPYIVAELNVAAAKPHRLRGLLESVDEAEGSFKVTLRPFLKAFAHDGARRFGGLNVYTADDTTYEIDGVAYTGSAGLTALSALGANAAVIVVGKLDTTTRHFTATEVYAGSSVPGGDADAVVGHVIARNGDVITVTGATLVRDTGAMKFRSTVAVTLGTAAVSKQGDPDAVLTTADISVGQRVAVLGDLGADLSEVDNLTLTASHVRLLYTHVVGAVTGTAPLTLNVRTIDGRPVARFDFGGHADPTAYVIDTGALDLSQVAVDEIVKAIGFMQPVSNTASDFAAVTVVDYTEHAMRSRLDVGWLTGTAQPLAAASAAAMTVDITGAAVAAVRTGPTRTALVGNPVIQPAPTGPAVYLIKQHAAVTLHRDFASFVADLQSRLDGTTEIGWLTAKGGFDSETSTLSATHIAVKFEKKGFGQLRKLTHPHGPKG